MTTREEGYVLVDLLVGLAIFAIVLGSAQSVARQFFVARTALEADAAQRVLALKSILTLSNGFERARLQLDNSAPMEANIGPMTVWTIPRSNWVVGAMAGLSINETKAGRRELRLHVVEEDSQQPARLLIPDQDQVNMELIAPLNALSTSRANQLWLGLNIGIKANKNNRAQQTFALVPVPRFSSMLCSARPFEQRCLQ